MKWYYWIIIAVIIIFILYSLNSIQVSESQIILNLNYKGLNYPVLVIGGMLLISLITTVELYRK